MFFFPLRRMRRLSLVEQSCKYTNTERIAPTEHRRFFRKGALVKVYPGRDSISLPHEMFNRTEESYIEFNHGQRIWHCSREGTQSLLAGQWEGGPSFFAV